MSHPAFRFIIRYVANTENSAAFYAKLFAAPIIEAAPTFAMLKLNDGAMLGLWRRDGVEPPAAIGGGAEEIVFMVADAAAVDRAHEQWAAQSVAIIQTPITMDFGRTFCAQDPDGLRIRVLYAAA